MTMKKILYYFKKYWYYEILALIFTVASIFLSIRANWIIKSLIDDALVPRALELLITLSISFVALVMLSVLLDLGARFLFSKLGQRIVFDLRTNMFSHLLKLPYDYFVKNQTGDMITRLISDPINVQKTVSAALVDFITSLITIVGVLTWLFIVNWRLTLILIPVVPLFIIIFMKVNKGVQKYSQKTQQLVSKSTSLSQEAISGIVDLKSLNAGSYILNKFKKLANELAKVTIRRNVLVDSSNFIGKFVLMPYQAVIIGIGGLWYINNGEPSIGTIFAYTNFMNILIQPSLKLIMVISQFSQSSASFDRIFHLFDEAVEKEDGLPSHSFKGTINFENVSYSIDDKSILQDVNLNINESSNQLIIGPTGSGKTTFTRLMNRLIEPTSGNIRINGTNLSDLKVSDVRNNIVFIPQETYLFNSSIKENLLLGLTNVSDDIIIDCCKKAQIHEMIMSLPDGYNSIVQERGKNLSAGEKQRLSIARALIRQPQIIIMDEPTANLDKKTSQEFLKMIQDTLLDQSIIIISHAEVTHLNIDQTIQVESGHVEVSNT